MHVDPLCWRQTTLVKAILTAISEWATRDGGATRATRFFLALASGKASWMPLPQVTFEVSLSQGLQIRAKPTCTVHYALKGVCLNCANGMTSKNNTLIICHFCNSFCKFCLVDLMELNRFIANSTKLLRCAGVDFWI
eukprot:2831418-Amphidinium_carterae.1